MVHCLHSRLRSTRPTDPTQPIRPSRTDPTDRPSSKPPGDARHKINFASPWEFLFRRSRTPETILWLPATGRAPPAGLVGCCADQRQGSTPWPLDRCTQPPTAQIAHLLRPPLSNSPHPRKQISWPSHHSASYGTHNLKIGTPSTTTILELFLAL